MKQKTTFYFLPADKKDERRISVEVNNYPVKPSKGEEVEIPIPVVRKNSPSKYIYGTVNKVIHYPMSCYFDSGANVDCLVRLSKKGMDEAYNFLMEWEKQHGGKLTHQWANWRIFMAFTL